MSHGSIEKCEPNLIPMLDLVLQLIMFFMLVTNFIADDLNEAVKLPNAIQARPLDKNEDYVITLNVDRKGRLLLMKGNEKEIDAVLAKNPADPRVKTNKIEMAVFMKDKKRIDDQRIEDTKKKNPNANPRLSLVVVRAHRDATFKMVNEVLEACRMAGYADVQLRATRGAAPQ